MVSTANPFAARGEDAPVVHAQAARGQPVARGEDAPVVQPHGGFGHAHGTSCPCASCAQARDDAGGAGDPAGQAAVADPVGALTQPGDAPNNVRALLAYYNDDDPNNVWEGSRWNDPAPWGTPMVVSYSFMTEVPAGNDDPGLPGQQPVTGFRELGRWQESAVRAALDDFAQISGLRFIELDGGGDITFGLSTFQGSYRWAAGYADYPSVAYNWHPSEVWFDRADMSAVRWGAGTWQYELVLHEIGHALGLKHPHQGAFRLPASRDNDIYTVMSYTERIVAREPRSLDEGAVQFIYGEAGDTAPGVTQVLDEARGVVTSTGDGSGNLLLGSGARDVMSGGGGADTLFGRSGDDTLDGGAGADDLRGGDGTDFVSYASSGAGVDASLLRGDGTGGDGQRDLYSDVEGLIGSGFADLLAGGAGGESLFGGAGDDSLFGGGGADNLFGEAGRDSLAGGEGADTLQGGGGRDFLFGDASADRLIGQGGNDVLYGGLGDDRLEGSAGADTLRGGDGVDQLFGGGQADRLFGEGGNDQLSGQNGNDRLFGGTGNDRLDGGGGANLLRGGGGLDTLLGRGQADRLFGEGGNDELFGHSGNDRLEGGNGADLLRGGSGRDTLLGQGLGDRLFGEGGDDLLYGGLGADRLYGGLGNDTLGGGQGRDRLFGGAGDDRLSGNGGADRFVFANGFGDDTIVDFNALSGAETIDLAAVTGITSFADLQTNHLGLVGGIATISDGADTISLLGVNLAHLDGSDFIF